MGNSVGPGNGVYVVWSLEKDIGGALYRRENFSYQKYGKILEFFHKNVKWNRLIFLDVKV